MNSLLQRKLDALYHNYVFHIRRFHPDEKDTNRVVALARELHSEICTLSESQYDELRRLEAENEGLHARVKSLEQYASELQRELAKLNSDRAEAEIEKTITPIASEDTPVGVCVEVQPEPEQEDDPTFYDIAIRLAELTLQRSMERPEELSPAAALGDVAEAFELMTRNTRDI